jgi:predicted HD phosphohydrolase
VNTTRITSLAGATRAQWEANERVAEAIDTTLPDRVLALLRMLDGMDDGFAVDQLAHGLQTATRAERAGADDDLVVAALVHDVGKIFGDPNHDSVAGEIVRPYVRDEAYRAVRHHQDFTARYIAPILGGDPDRRHRWRDEPWFDVAERFADEWDQPSFDPDYPTEPLEHFEPAVRHVFSVAAQPTQGQPG